VAEGGMVSPDLFHSNYTRFIYKHGSREVPGTDREIILFWVQIKDVIENPFLMVADETWRLFP